MDNCQRLKIEARAQELSEWYRERGDPPDQLRDWLEAEKEVLLQEALIANIKHKFNSFVMLVDRISSMTDELKKQIEELGLGASPVRMCEKAPPIKKEET